MSDEYEKIQEMLDGSYQQESHSEKTEFLHILKELLIIAPLTLLLIGILGYFISKNGNLTFWQATVVGSFIPVGLGFSIFIYNMQVGYGTMMGEMSRRAWTNSDHNQGYLNDFRNFFSFGTIVYGPMFVGVLYLIGFYIVNGNLY